MISLGSPSPKSAPSPGKAGPPLQPCNCIIQQGIWPNPAHPPLKPAASSRLLCPESRLSRLPLAPPVPHLRRAVRRERLLLARHAHQPLLALAHGVVHLPQAPGRATLSAAAPVGSLALELSEAQKLERRALPAWPPPQRGCFCAGAPAAAACALRRPTIAAVAAALRATPHARPPPKDRRPAASPCPPRQLTNRPMLRRAP